MSRPLAPSKRDNTNTTPPPDVRGQKNLHSPWSAQRERKRPARCEPAPQLTCQVVLGTIEEDYTSPPKRRNGGNSPAARELRLPAALPLVIDDDLEAGGPLGQGLRLQTSPDGRDDGFSPLATGLTRVSFTFTAGVAASLAAHSSQQQCSSSGSSSLCPREPEMAAGAPAPRQCLPTAAVPAAGQRLDCTAVVGPLSCAAGSPPELADCSYGLLGGSCVWTAPPVACSVAAHTLEHLAAAAVEHPRPMSQLTDRSRRSVSDLDHDMRSSWGSERSADVVPWREMQARLQDEFAPVVGQLAGGAGAAERGQAPPLPPPGHGAGWGVHHHHHQQQQHAGQQQHHQRLMGHTAAHPLASRGHAEAAVGAVAAHDPMRSSTDSQLRDSLELQSCCTEPERQASLVPLRTSVKGHWQQSHLASPVADGRMHRPPSTQSAAPQRPLGSAQKTRGMCFACASPFSSCKPRPMACGRAEEDDGYEVVRRVESEEFVLHRTRSFDAERLERPSGAGKPRRESLNRPPSPADLLVHRQNGFSTKCCSTPVHLLSPQSAYSEEEEGAACGCSPELEQAPTSQELLACLRDQNKNPTIDELNDMLRTFCTLDFHPKDAEELVSEASKAFSLAPNATTLRTLDKIWAAHDQMYG